MKVFFFQQEFQVQSLTKLREVLSSRHESSLASFWLYHDRGPRLAIMVNAAEASVHYFPNDNHPGFVAQGSLPNWDEMVYFIADNFERTDMPRALVVSFDTALAAAEEFFATGATPTALNWEEL